MSLNYPISLCLKLLGEWEKIWVLVETKMKRWGSRGGGVVIISTIIDWGGFAFDNFKIVPHPKIPGYF